MKKLFLLLIVMVSLFSMSSCVAMEDLSYENEYIIEGRSYPVYYINSYPYYWYDNTWILIPSYRYVYIRHFDRPRYIHAYRPRAHRYYTPRPNNRYGVPHTRQPHSVYPSHRHGSFGSGRINNGGSHGRFSRGK